jgi:GDP-L-fucose synthase
MDLTTTRIVITGGSGFLGRHLDAALWARGCRQVVPLATRDGDLTDAATAARLLLSLHPDVVFHLAAVCGGIGANQGRPGYFMHQNLLLGANVLEACWRAGVAKVVTVGTVCAYPKHTPTPFHETYLWNGYPEETNAPYGVAKRALLTLGQAYRAEYGMNIVHVVPANLYGPGDHFAGDGTHVIPAMIRKLVAAQRDGSSVSLWGDGTPTREFLYVTDAAEGLCLAAERLERGDPVNLGTGVDVSMRNLAALVAGAVGSRPTIVWDPTRPNGQPRRRLDVARARDWLGFTAATTLANGLAATVAWYRAHAWHRDQAFGLDVAPEDEGGGEG